MISQSGFLLAYGENAQPWYQPSESSKKIVLGSSSGRLPARSARRRTLLQMHHNGLDHSRIGDIRDHPQRATAKRTD